MGDRPELRIGMISFTNATPFRFVPPRFKAQIVFGDPSELTALMMEGKLDVCLLPTGSPIHLEEKVKPLGPYGIASYGHVMSVRLFSKVALAELLEKDRAMHLTQRSTTTRKLLQILFKKEFGATPRISSDPSESDARLLIGDEALNFARQEYRWPVNRDIGEWWMEQTGHGFVFAQWVVSPTVSDESVSDLTQWIEENLTFAATAEGRRSLREAGTAAGWNPDMAELYFERLEFRLTQVHLEGLSYFHRLLKGTDDGD
ncbi:protein of unknown function DUF178 [Terriglobus saanensis SP1PR4]|uniref:Chorismate dehydratase n=2 Tax=Terriglobus saanensis TaxID=870903 RepID=E8V4F2_TERSS|nr:protein of unknown function DUF178 [Terriglobus saanensis SP1PR4]